MDSIYAKKILESLADGVNPLTGEILSENDSCNQPDVIRALNYAVNVLEKTARRAHTQPENAGKPWKEEDDKELSAMYDRGVSVNELSHRFKRTESAIYTRLVRLGKVPPQFTRWK